MCAMYVAAFTKTAIILCQILVFYDDLRKNIYVRSLSELMEISRKYFSVFFIG